MDPQQRLASEDAVEPLAQEPVQRSNAQGPNRHPLEVLDRERSLECRGLNSIRQPPREQQQHAARRGPSKREAEGARRGRVEPLHVVDRDDDRPVVRQHLQRGASRDPERPRIDPVCGRILEEECALERAASRRRQRRQHDVEDVLEQVAEARQSQTALGLGGPRGKDAQSPRMCTLDARKPKRRLPNASLALEHESSRPSLRQAGKAVDGKQAHPLCR